LPEQSREILVTSAIRTTRLAVLRLAVLGIVCFPALLVAEQLPQETLSTFPADTLQVAFTNLAELRSTSAYPQIRRRFLNQQLRAFQDFLRPLGIDPDRDLDEVMVGWRGEIAGPSGYLGLAAGRFQPDLVEKYFDRTNLPIRQYAGANLYGFGSGSDPADLFFTFFNSSIAAFGRLADLKAMIDARQGSANALNANADFVNWEGELEDTAPQWGILNGKSVSNLAGLWLAGGKKNVDFSSLGRSVRALLYRVQWDTGFSAQLTLVCDTPESAAGFAQLLNLLQKPPPQPAAAGGTGMPSILQNIDAHRDGARLELDVSGPPEALGQILGRN
jgi:hypothetical protein